MSEPGSLQLTSGLIVHRGHELDVHSIAFSPDGKSIVSGSSDETVRIWDAKSASAISSLLTGHSDAIRSVSYSPLGDMVASGSTDRTIRLWNTSTGRQIGTPLEGHDGFIYSVAFSPTADIIASGSGDRAIILWNTRSGVPTSRPLTGHTKSVNSVAFLDNNIHMASGSDDATLRIWDIEYRKTIVGPLKHGAWVRSVATFSNSYTIASGADDKTIKLWDVRSGHPIGEPYIGHTGWVTSVAPSLDGTYFASSASDQTVRFWDVRTGHQLGISFTRHNGSVNSIAFSPCNGRIATCSADQTCMIWDISDRGSDQSRALQVKIGDAAPVIVESTEPNSPTGAEDKKVTLQDAFDIMLYHGCANLTTIMDVDQRDAVIVNGGGFGNIWMAKLHNGSKVSIKTWRAGMVEQCTRKTLKHATREVHTWSQMKHQNIHELMGVIIFQGYYIGMVSEWMDNGNLHEYIHKYPQLNRHEMCAQVTSGLAHMHRCRVIHGDIKALNVLVSSNGVAKLTDFGLSIASEASLVFSETSNIAAGSTRWAAPEQIMDTLPKSRESDVYALGMTMLEIFTGAVPYSQQHKDYQVIMKVSQGILPPRPDVFKDDSYGNSLWELLVCCWSRDPATRPSARQVHVLLYDIASMG